MSGFDRTLRGLSSRELLECARGLLACLTGGEGGSARNTADAADFEPVRRGGPEPAVNTAREARARGTRGAQVQRRAGYEYGAGDYPDGREPFERDTPDAGRGAGGGEGVTAETRRRDGDFYAVSDPAARGGTSDREVNPASGAAFCGPERRYDGAVGARGMEMSRVSDFFRRDSRRYDTGFALK